MIIPARAYVVPIAAAAVIMLVGVRAHAGPSNDSSLPPGIDCPTIRALVEYHGKTQALYWALKQGYSLSQINAARRCLKSGN